MNDADLVTLDQSSHGLDHCSGQEKMTSQSKWRNGAWKGMKAMVDEDDSI
jgi:hypothetical protein